MVDRLGLASDVPALDTQRMAGNNLVFARCAARLAVNLTRQQAAYSGYLSKCQSVGPGLPARAAVSAGAVAARGENLAGIQ
jgi:hypothetical protein